MIKHKVIKEYQYLSPDKKIFILKIGTILENYIYRVKNESIPIDKDIIENNPGYFETIEWRSELLIYLKSQKIPQPAQISKKLVPFIEEMILSSMKGTDKVFEIDEGRVKEIEWKESELNNRERRTNDKEEEIEIRLKRVEKRELNHKEELKQLDKKEYELRNRSKELTKKDIDLEDKNQSLNERERNFDRSLLDANENLDNKYVELQAKIDIDLKSVEDKEKKFEILSKNLKIKEEELNKLESNINDKIRDFNIKFEDFKLYEEEIRKIDTEIKEWEGQHWKFKRMWKPPSALEN